MSGCDKTSTLRMIAGHETVSAGAVVSGGHELTDLPPARRGTATMFQSYALFHHLPGLDNVVFARATWIDHHSYQATDSRKSPWPYKCQ